MTGVQTCALPIYSNVSWGYGNAPKTVEEFYERLEALTDVILSMSDSICGYCYTQLTDVEQEQNGVYYYSRGEKFGMKRIRAVFSKVPDGYILGKGDSFHHKQTTKR